MWKRNTVILASIPERNNTLPRLALVKRVLKDGRVKCVCALYRDSNIISDCVLDPQDVIVATPVPAAMFYALAVCLPHKDPNCKIYQSQQRADSAWPKYAALRKNYGSYESIEEGIARLRAEGKLAA